MLEEEVNIDFTKLGYPKLVDSEGHRYKTSSGQDVLRSGKVIFWRCNSTERQKCTATAKTCKNQVIEWNGGHNHKPSWKSNSDRIACNYCSTYHAPSTGALRKHVYKLHREMHLKAKKIIEI